MKIWYFLLFFALQGTASLCSAAPVLVLQGGNTYQRGAVIVSNDGKWIASANLGHNIKIFDGNRGLQWGEFSMDSGTSPLRFTPDAKHILTETEVLDEFNVPHPQVNLCEVPSGRKVYSFDVLPYSVWCDNTCLRGIKDSTVVEFDLKSGGQNFAKEIQEASKFGIIGDGLPYGPRYAFSENGTFLIEGCSGVIRWWSASNGLLRGRIKDTLRAIGQTAISNDGKWLVSTGDDPNWKSPPKGEFTPTESAYARDSQLHIWSAATRNVKHTFPRYRAIRFSPDGRTLFAADYERLYRIDVRSGKSSPLPKEDSKMVKSFYGAVHGAQLVKWSPDGKYLAGADNSAIMLWDAHTGKLLAQKLNPYAADFSWADDKTIRSQTNEKMQVWSVPDLRLKSEFDFNVPPQDESTFRYSGGLSISPDGCTILTKNTMNFDRDELCVWDVATKKQLHKIKREDSDWGFTDFRHMVWLPGNRHVVFGTNSGLAVLNTQTGNIEHEQKNPFPAHDKDQYLKGVLYPLRVSSDGKWLAVLAQRYRKTVVFDLQTWSVNTEGGLAWWKHANSAFDLPGAPQTDGDLSPDGRLIAFGSAIWNVKTGREVLRLYLLGDNSPSTSHDWIALTPEGYYDASPEGEKHLRWREGNKFWPITKSRARFKRPDIVAKALHP